MDRIYAPWRSMYFKMDKPEGCLFCEVQNQKEDRDAGILHRGKHWFVIINLFPYTSGHIMVVARRHIGRLAEISADEGAELVGLLAACERALDEVYRPDAMNTGVNRGASAGAGVDGHIHFHLVPRWNGDTNFMTAVGGTRVISEDLAESYARLRPFFAAL